MSGDVAIAQPARAPIASTRPTPIDARVARAVEARSDESADVAPRHDLEAERAVLGAVIIDAAVLHAVRPHVEPSAFYHPSHAAIFEAMCALLDRSEPIDVVTIAAELRARGRLNAIGGLQYLGDLAEATPTTAHAEAHAQLVTELANVRKLGALGRQLASMAADPRSSAEEILEKGSSALLSFSFTKTESPVVELGTLLERFFDQQSSDVDPFCARPTCMRDLDKALLGGGLRPGQLITVAGRPAMGKSSFAQQIALQIAVRTRKPALYFSMEMSRAELLGRTLCAEADVDSEKLMARSWDDEEHERLLGAAARIYQAPLVFIDTSELSFHTLRAICMQRRQQHGELGVVVIDYLQLMQLRMGRDDNRARALGDLTRQLKVLAGTLDCPIVILSQLNRELEKRPNKRPQLSDLRESGSIENDSDAVLFIYRDEKYNKDSEDKGIAEIIIGKQRGGPTETVRLGFRADRTKFLDLDEHAEREREIERYASRTKSKRSKRSYATATEEDE